MTSSAQLLDIWKATLGEHKNLWTYFITVTVAVVGFSFSDSLSSMGIGTRIALLIALAAFLVSNAVSLYTNVRVFNAAVLELQAKKEELGTVADALRTVPPLVLLVLHAVLAVAAFVVVIYRAF